MSIVMTANEYTERMIALGNHRPSAYHNKYPYNCLYVLPDGTITGDCVNIQKCLLNGYNIADLDRRGTFMPANKFTNTGDCTETGLINQCTEVSTNFSNLKAGEPRVLYMASPGHIGGYLGKEITDPYGHICNVVEATSDSVIGNGILFSYVDAGGNRFSYKGGSKSGRWIKHGKPSKWVDYSKTEEEGVFDMAKIWPVYQGCTDGGHVRSVQALLNSKNGAGLVVDGNCGAKTAQAIRNFQAVRGLVVDGYCGEKTWTELVCWNH